jgi:hypothetical protein
MSTYLHLVCMGHNPPLVAEQESGQHLYELPRIRADIEMRTELVRKYRGEDGTFGMFNLHDIVGYFSANSAKFLSEHEECVIGIRDEYGVNYPIKEGS